MAMTKENDYISLKEASEISGYSADYIGQLIRAGKLSGKQVFSNVVWVTTESAIREYIDKNKKRQDGSKEESASFTAWLFSAEGMTSVYTAVVWFAVGVFAIFLLMLGYIFAVSVDHKIERNNLEKWELRSQAV